MFVIGIHGKNRTGHLVHDVRGRSGHDHGFRKAVRQFTMGFQNGLEHFQLIFGRQTAKQQQPHDFFKHESVFLYSFIYNVIEINAAVDQSAFPRQDIVILISCIASWARESCLVSGYIISSLPC